MGSRQKVVLARTAIFVFVMIWGLLLTYTLDIGNSYKRIGDGKIITWVSNTFGSN